MLERLVDPRLLLKLIHEQHMGLPCWLLSLPQQYLFQAQIGNATLDWEPQTMVLYFKVVRGQESLLPEVRGSQSLLLKLPCSRYCYVCPLQTRCLSPAIFNNQFVLDVLSNLSGLYCCSHLSLLEDKLRMLMSGSKWVLSSSGKSTVISQLKVFPSHLWRAHALIIITCRRQNPKVSTRKLLNLISTFSQELQYKIHI